MADSISVQAILSVKDKNFTSTMKAAQNALSGLDSSTSKASSGVGALGTAFAVAQTVVSAACNVIKSSVSEAVSRVDTLNQYPKIMEQMGFSSEQAEASVQKLSDRIQGLPTSLDSIVSSTQSIALLTGDLDLATDTALALNDAFLASGSSTAEAERGLTQYTQMLSSGKVDMQSWKTLQETMGYALSETAKQLGITSGNTYELYSALQSGSITFDEFNAAIIECDTCTGGFAETAMIACDGIATSWENVKTAVVRGVANMIQAWNEAAADNGLPTIQENLHTLQDVCDKVFTAASKAITVFVNNLDTIVAAVAPAVTAIAGFKIVQTVNQYFTQFKKSAQASCDVLQNYSKRAEEAKTATENVKTAEQALKNAMEESKTALNNVAAAQEKLNAAYEKRDAAAQKVAEAEEKVAASTEENSTAADELTAANQELEAAEKEVEAAQKEVNKTMEEKKEATEQTAQATQQLSDAQEAEASAIEGTTLKAIAHSAIMNVLTGQMSVGKAAVEAFNAAWDANPIGLVTTAITAAVSAFTALISVLKKFGVIEESVSDRWKEMKDSYESFVDSLAETDAEIEKNISAAERDCGTIRSLAGQVDMLAGNQNRTAAQTDLLNSSISQLNDMIPGLNASFDETTNSLNMTQEAFDAFTNAAAQMDLLQASTDACTEKEQELAEITEQLGIMQDEATASTEQLVEGKGLLHGASLMDVIACRQEQAAVEELKGAQAQATEELDKLQTQRQGAIENTKEAVIEAYNQECAALDEMVANNTISYDQLSEANQAVADSMRDTWNDYADAATNIFDTIDTETDLTVEQMQANIDANQAAMEGWGDNTQTLRDRFAGMGLDTALLDQLVDLGPDGAAYIAELVTASDDELINLETSFENGATVATDAMMKVYGDAAGEIPDSIQEYITTPTATSLTDQLSNIDWSEPSENLMENLFNDLQGACGDLSFDELGIDVGKDLTGGVGSGMEDTSSIESASEIVATDTEEDLRNATQTNSPSEMTKPIGTDLNEGIAEGMKETDSLLSAAEEVATAVDEALHSAFDAMDFSDIFDGFADAATSGMATVEQAVTSGMQTVSTAMSTGFTNMGSSVSTEMATIASVVSSGMANVSTVMTTGVQGVRSALTEGFSGMSTAVTSSMSSIQSAVSSGMSSVTSTMTSGVNSVKTALTNGFQNMATTVNTQMNKIKSTITTTMNNIKSTMTTQLNNIKTTWTNTMNNIQTTTTNGLNKVKSAFTNAMSSIRSTASSTASSIISTFNSMYSGMYSAGCNAMSGLQAGLNARSGSVLATARSIANSVTSTINSALKVGSPSRVMKSTGKDTIQGLVNGMKAMLSDVKDMSVKIADTVSDMVFGTFDSPKLAFEGGAELSMDYYFDSVGILDALDDLKDAVIEESQKPVEITTVTELDGREIAKGTAQYMQDAQDKLQARKSRRDQFSISGG